jgi:hypothetical protein
MRFLRQLLGGSLSDKIINTDIRTQLGTERMVEHVQEYQRKLHNNVERMSSLGLPWQAHSKPSL